VGGPLDGIKVLELSNFISGPYAAMLLSDLGADVVKAEMPGSGDPFRSFGQKKIDLRPQFAAYNRGKRSITLNVQTESGQQLFRKLAAQSDVVMENFRPGTLDRLGIGYGALRELNPRLVYCSLTGMGASGPYKRKPTYDAIAQATSGIWSMFTDMDDPKPSGPAMADQLSGLYAAYGILAALVRRGITGQGQKVELSMLAAGVAFMIEPIVGYLMSGHMDNQRSRPRRSQSYAFLAGDRKPLAIHLSSPPKFWEGLCAAVGRPELIEDPRFKSKDLRVEAYDTLHQIFSEIFRTRPRAEWLEVLEAADVPSAPINNVREVVEDQQVNHLGLIRAFGQGERALRLVGFPVSFEESACNVERGVPRLGEHSDEVYRSLGYTEDQLAELRMQGAI
jgi:crotonobetainyl-CoA:carnitine CoA-transferase CaiB-like acyl-CoA transferase